MTFIFPDLLTREFEQEMNELRAHTCIPTSVYTPQISFGYRLLPIPFDWVVVRQSPELKARLNVVRDGYPGRKAGNSGWPGILRSDEGLVGGMAM